MNRLKFSIEIAHAIVLATCVLSISNTVSADTLNPPRLAQFWADRIIIKSGSIATFHLTMVPDPDSGSMAILKTSDSTALPVPGGIRVDIAG